MGAWVHVDFGYSISSMFLPNSMSLLEEKSFVATHLWNHEAYNDTSMELAWQKTYPRYKASIRADEKTIDAQWSEHIIGRAFNDL